MLCGNFSVLLQALSTLHPAMKKRGCGCAEDVGDRMTPKPAAESQHGKTPGFVCLQMGFPLWNSAFDPPGCSTFHWLPQEWLCLPGDLPWMTHVCHTTVGFRLCVKWADAPGWGWGNRSSGKQRPCLRCKGFACRVLSAKTSPNLELHTEQTIPANTHTDRKTFWQQNVIYVS